MYIFQFFVLKFIFIMIEFELQLELKFGNYVILQQDIFSVTSSNAEVFKNWN